MAWHTITVPDAPPKIASTLAGLGSGAYDGHVGIIRIGTWPDQREETFIWNGTSSKWIGTREYVVLSALDAWAMDWSRSPLALVRNKWARPSGGVSFQIIGPRAYLVSDITLPISGGDLITKAPSFVANAFDAAGQVLLRDALLTYSSYTVGSTDSTGTTVTFHGVTSQSYNDGFTYYGGHTPVIPYGAAAGGDQGGWGTSVQSLDRVGEMWAAGFRLEERLDGFFNGTTDLTSVQFAPFYLNTNVNEDLGAQANYPGIFKNAEDVPNLLGPGVTVTGPAYDMGGYTVPGDHFPYSERGFERRTTAWTPWAATAPTKRILTPILYGKHNSAAKGTGETYSLNLMLRWVSS